MNRRHLFYIMLFTSPFVFSSERYKGVDLWLPKTYQQEYTRLLKAADKVKADPYCHQLLSGRLNENKTATDHLHFVFRCRADDRHTFSIQVDGKTLDTINEYGIERARLEAQQELDKKLAEDENARKGQRDLAAKQKKLTEEEKRVIAESLKLRRRQESQYWQICRKDIRKKLKNFNGITILSDSLPEPIIQADQFTYSVVFDSLSPSKKTLHFQANCVISASDHYTTIVRPRKTIKDNE